MKKRRVECSMRRLRQGLTSSIRGDAKNVDPEAPEAYITPHLAKLEPTAKSPALIAARKS